MLQLLVLVAFAQKQDEIPQKQEGKLWLEEVVDFQKELNEKFSDSEKSPLKESDRLQFESLDFFPPDDRYRVRAEFIRTVGEEPFQMPTTTSRMANYVKYGELRFDLGGHRYVLNVYQNLDATEEGEKPELLFLPFTDATNGESTYGGGRYIDLPVPQKDVVVLDFNKAYNPYCAYNEKYSCPIPPKSNDIDIKVRAGVKDFAKK
ncbi:DUF1684 domain-containing protein [Flavobacteriales bacterium DA487]